MEKKFYHFDVVKVHKYLATTYTDKVTKSREELAYEFAGAESIDVVLTAKKGKKARKINVARIEPEDKKSLEDGIKRATIMAFKEQREYDKVFANVEIVTQDNNYVTYYSISLKDYLDIVSPEFESCAESGK